MSCVLPSKTKALQRFFTKNLYDVIVLEKLPSVTGNVETLCIWLYFTLALAFLVLAAFQRSIAALALIPGITDIFMRIADAVLGRPIYVVRTERSVLLDKLSEQMQEFRWNSNARILTAWVGSQEVGWQEVSKGQQLRRVRLRLRLHKTDKDLYELQESDTRESADFLKYLLTHDPKDPQVQVGREAALALGNVLPDSLLKSEPLRIHMFRDRATDIVLDFDDLAAKEWGYLSSEKLYEEILPRLYEAEILPRLGRTRLSELPLSEIDTL